MTISALANRGFNLLSPAALGMGGLLFGAVVFQEQDITDKVDDAGFLVIAAASVAWYLWRENRFERSGTPIVIAVVAVLVQVAGFIFERDDPKAFGDNVGGLLYFVAVLVLLVFQYQATRRISSPAPPQSSTPPTISTR